MADTEPDNCLLALLERLDEAGYRFVTPTPATHARYLAREGGRPARDLRDVFGWSLPFGDGDVPGWAVDLLRASRMLDVDGGLFRSRLRVSSLGTQLCLHSAYPTDAPDAVFFGPDTYRFARFLKKELSGRSAAIQLVDIGAGSGAGAIAASALLPGTRLTLTDTNPFALRLARVNARHAGLDVEIVQGSGVEGVADGFDLAIANPPFIADPGGCTYRDGGDMHGAALSLAWAEAAARRLAPGGRMLLYTASAIVGGADQLEAALRAMLPVHGCALRYEEIDPDIFGEQLGQPGYEGVERIAAVGVVIDKATNV
jgi:SAM-dependent methyltransferase